MATFLGGFSLMWHGVRGHDPIVERFRRTLARGRLSSTYLFVGPSGIGKRTFALRLAQALLCQASQEAELASCGKCPSCLLFNSGNHPDLMLVQKPAGKSSLPIELFIGKGDKRNQEGLCHDISMRPMVSQRRVAIIDDADAFNEASANCLLKTLEEPPPRSLIILLGTSLTKQLPTIRSRAQVVRFALLSTEDVSAIMLAGSHVADAAEATRMVQRSFGSVEQALAAKDGTLWQFRKEFLKELAAMRLNEVRLAKMVEDFVKEAGAAAPPRRTRLRQVIGFAVEFYRGLLHTLITGASLSEGDPALVQTAQRNFSEAGMEDRVLGALQICLAAEEYILRNANQSTVVQWWLGELATNFAPNRRNLRVSPV